MGGILCRGEVLYGVKNKHIETLKKCDKLFFTKLFNIPGSCSYEAIFFETGAIPIRFILIGRRLMYYWSLLNKSDNELAKVFFEAQKKFTVKDDWVLEIKENLEFCDINLTEEEIKKLPKRKFKKLVNKQIKLRAEEFLSSIQDGHSKTKDLGTYKFQPYLLNKNTTTKEKQLLFQLWTRSTPTRASYKNKFKFDVSCPLCKDKTIEQTDAHLLNCSALKPKLEKVSHEMIFSNFEDQTKIVKVYHKIFKSI